jgi:ketosteroid isomerase-like protein
MTEPVLHITSADEAETVFYEAFMHGDADVMAALWAKDNVVCVHPGSGIISGHEAVVRSWRHIFGNFHGGNIRYTVLNKTATGDLAVHVVAEEIMDDDVMAAVVLATNVYKKFSQGWRMVEHHGSVVQQEHEGRTLQ